MTYQRRISSQKFGVHILLLVSLLFHLFLSLDGKRYHGFLRKFYRGENFNTFEASDVGPPILGKSIQNNTLAVAGGAYYISSKHFSMRATCYFTSLTTNSFQFRTYSDDGVRVWFNGTLIIDHWTVHSATIHTSNWLQLRKDETYEIKLEYFQVEGNAKLELDWRSEKRPDYFLLPVEATAPDYPYPSAPLISLPVKERGVWREYYGDLKFTKLIAADKGEVDFNWSKSTSATIRFLSPTFSLRFQGNVLPEVSGHYQFLLESEGCYRLWVADDLVFDFWTNHTKRQDTSGPIFLSGSHLTPIKIEYAHRTGPEGQLLSLKWRRWTESSERSSGSTEFHVIPTENLYPPSFLFNMVDSLNNQTKGSGGEDPSKNPSTAITVVVVIGVILLVAVAVAGMYFCWKKYIHKDVIAHKLDIQDRFGDQLPAEGVVDHDDDDDS